MIELLIIGLVVYSFLYLIWIGVEKAILFFVRMFLKGG